ncbi:MAG: ABC transporter permease subunit [Rhizobiales bacterium]|nr:ABC transporter permease subunit [Hyphomicrobiales bacterium]
MTDAVSKGRSLWADAWGRLKANRAAVWSGVYLAVIVALCLVGPNLTGHQFSTIYQSYVRVPPSLSAYPKPQSLDAEIKEVAKRAHLDLKEWGAKGDRIFVTVTSAKPIDPRVTRYLDRSDSFEDSKVENRSDDGLSMTISTAVKYIHFYFGTDTSGRDLLTRTLIAGRVSLAVGLLAGVVAVLIGVLYGAISGFAGGKTDEVMMRIVDILYSLPFTFFVIMLVVFFGRNFMLMFIAIGAVLWLDMSRIVRGQTLSIKRQEFVLAAEALGVGSTGVLLRHIVPNMLGPIIIYVTLLIPQVIILESFLSYLGLGVQEPMSSWGVQISQGSRNMEGAAWLLIFPSFFLTSTLFALNFIGDGLRDTLDPKDR